MQLGALGEEEDGCLPPASPASSVLTLAPAPAAALMLLGFILIIAAVIELVLTNMDFNNILHLFSIFALKISEVLNRRQWKSSPVFPQGKLKQAAKTSGVD